MTRFERIEKAENLPSLVVEQWIDAVLKDEPVHGAKNASLETDGISRVGKFQNVSQT